jgi:dihydroorotate dehydrogenase (NAD+) catalytic subunit
MPPQLAVEIAGPKQSLVLRNPVMVASGTFSNGLEYARIMAIDRLGAIVSKGVTRRPRRGNDTPRTVETAAGMLNSIGLQNIGVSAVIKELAPVWARWEVPVIVNIAGSDPEDFGYLAGRLDGVEGVAAIEVNVSCPNVSHGLDYGQDPVMAAEVVEQVAAATTLPVIVKLTPNVTDPADVAEAAAAAGASALTVSNTFLGMAIDSTTRQPTLPTTFGGLSGPAIKPLALRQVYEVAAAVTIPVIGSGGIINGRDALEFLMAGATAIQVGTATFQDPLASLRVLEELERLLQEDGVTDVHDVIGAAHGPARRGARQPQHVAVTAG